MEKTVLITGSSSGIGKETAELLANKGYKVLACVRKKTDKYKLEKINKNIQAVYLDVTNQSGIDKAYWYVLKKINKLDAIINCAGMCVAGPMEALPIKKIKEQFDVNTFGTIAVVQKFLPLLNGEGKIIYISSMASSGIFPFISPYCASKKAADIMLNSLSVEFKSEGIDIVSVKPGCIITPFWDKSVNNNMPVFETATEHIKQKYDKEMKFLAENAKANNYRGTLPVEVAKTILKVIETKNPKCSYTVGNDAALTMFAAKVLPLNVMNFLIKKGLRLRMKNKLSSKKVFLSIWLLAIFLFLFVFIFKLI